jgi:hypothetical protein
MILNPSVNASDRGRLSVSTSWPDGLVRRLHDEI